jgi:branched-chain amino acid transport system substrate-binding protein
VKAIEGAYYTVHFTADQPNAQAAGFLAAYQALYHHEPDQGAALSFDALQLLLSVVKDRQSVEAQKIAQGFRRLDVFEGVTGTAVFRGSPDPKKGMVVVRMRDQRPHFVVRIEP